MMKNLPLLKREIFLSYKNVNNLIVSIFFFIISIAIFIISIGPDRLIDSNIGNAIIWVVLLFTILLNVEQFFTRDFWDGSIKELQVLGFCPELIILTKLSTMYIFMIIPLLVIIPFIGPMLKVDMNELIILVLSIAIGSPTLLLISILGVLLTLQSKNTKILLVTLIFPFCIPIMIFGIGILEMYRSDMAILQNFFILFAIFLITLPITLISNKLAIEELNR